MLLYGALGLPGPMLKTYQTLEVPSRLRMQPEHILRLLCSTMSGCRGRGQMCLPSVVRFEPVRRTVTERSPARLSTCRPRSVLMGHRGVAV